MQHLELRCKHCGIRYTYCTYGNSDGCSKEYCGECQTAINEALSKIPKKITKRIDYITDKEEKLRLDSVFDIGKKRYEMTRLLAEDTSHSFPEIVPVISNWGYKSVERCYIYGVEYYRCYNEDGTFDIKAAKEFNLINKEYTGELYKEVGKYGHEYTPVLQSKFPVDIELLSEKPMSLPCGKLIYMDFKE